MSEDQDPKVAEVKGTITLADGSVSQFRIGTDGGWVQWDAYPERLRQSSEAVQAMAWGLLEDNLLVSDNDSDADNEPPVSG